MGRSREPEVETGGPGPGGASGISGGDTTPTGNPDTVGQVKGGQEKGEAKGGGF